jgi:methionyl-tRNA formyltransferase
MRLLLLANNWVGWQVAEWLAGRDEDIAGVVVHPAQKQKYRDEIVRSTGLDESRIFTGSSLRQPEVLATIQSLQAQIAVSIFFGYILRPEFLNSFSAGCINLHPSWLPYNRGAHPNVWSIIEGTPAGTTLHYVDAGVDTGDIIAQKKVDVEPSDTGETLYCRLERASVELFRHAWPEIRAGKAPRISQSGAVVSCHRTRDLEALDEIDLEATYKAKDLIDLIRARTFRPHPGAYFRSHGKKIFLRLDLADEPEPAQSLNG